MVDIRRGWSNVRVYRASLWARLSVLIFPTVGLGLLVTFWMGLIEWETDTESDWVPPEVLVTFAGLVFIGVGTYFTIRFWTERVIFGEDSIESVWRYVRRRLSFSEIEGRRLRVNSEGTSYVLVPTDDRLEEIALDSSFRFDRAFWSWFHSLPDLDERDRRRPRRIEKERLSLS